MSLRPGLDPERKETIMGVLVYDNIVHGGQIAFLRGHWEGMGLVRLARPQASRTTAIQVYRRAPRTQPVLFLSSNLYTPQVCNISKIL